MLALPMLLAAVLFAPPVEERLQARSFPSIFMPWANVDPLPDGEGTRRELELRAAAKHDLIFHGPQWFGLQFDVPSTVAWTSFSPESIDAARQTAATLRGHNPNVILLSEIRYRDAPPNALPDDHAWWLRDERGERIIGWPEGGYPRLDDSNPEFIAHVAAQCKAVMDTGVVDGVFFDWWIDEEPSRLALAEAVRAKIGDDALVLVNANDRTSPDTAHLINGSFMECWKSADWDNWTQIEQALVWNEANFRQPTINALSTWYDTGRDELDRVRATTALAMTRSDGFALFCDPGTLPTPDHLHDWYETWSFDFGQPTGDAVEQADGLVIRGFARGSVVYSPPGGGGRIEFSQPHRDLVTGEIGLRFALRGGDGGFYQPVPEKDGQRPPTTMPRRQ